MYTDCLLSYQPGVSKTASKVSDHDQVALKMYTRDGGDRDEFEA